MTAEKIAYCLLETSEEKRLEKTLLFLFIYFPLHPMNSRLEKEVDKILVRTFCADTTKCVNVFAFALLGDDDDGMPLQMQYIVGEEPSQSAISVTERM